MEEKMVIKKAVKGFTVTQGDELFAFSTLLDVAKELVSFLKFDAYSEMTITTERK